MPRHHRSKKSNTSSPRRSRAAATAVEAEPTDMEKAAEAAMEQAKDAGAQAATGARRGLESARRGVREAARLAEAHPGVAAGALVGVGLLVGAVAERALRKETTLTDVVLDTVSTRAQVVGKAVAAAARLGLKAASRSVRKTVS